MARRTSPVATGYAPPRRCARCSRPATIGSSSSGGAAMIDAAVVAAYLGAAVARGGRRLLDSAVDAGLDRLSAAVSRRLGHGPESDLAHDPDNPAVRAQVARGLATAARRDPAFARELASLAAQLDRSGGRRVLTNTVRAQVNVQAFD